MGAEHVFNLRGIAAALRDESTPVRDGHRQITIYHEAPVTLVVFDFEAGARLTDHQADAHVTILTLSGLFEVSTSEQTHQLPEGSLLVLEPAVRHDVYAPEGGQMLLGVTRTSDWP